MGFEPGVDDKGPGASPVLVGEGGADAVDVVAGVGPGEGGPEEVVQGCRGKTGVFGEDDEGKAGGVEIGRASCRERVFITV